jgi:hypothetical protein
VICSPEVVGGIVEPGPGKRLRRGHASKYFIKGGLELKRERVEGGVGCVISSSLFFPKYHMSHRVKWCESNEHFFTTRVLRNE